MKCDCVPANGVTRHTAWKTALESTGTLHYSFCKRIQLEDLKINITNVITEHLIFQFTYDKYIYKSQVAYIGWIWDVCTNQSMPFCSSHVVTTAGLRWQISLGQLLWDRDWAGSEKCSLNRFCWQSLIMGCYWNHNQAQPHCCYCHTWWTCWLPLQRWVTISQLLLWPLTHLKLYLQHKHYQIELHK